MEQIAPDMRRYASVQYWMSKVNKASPLSEEEWESRLATLDGFCRAQGKDPDSIIREALDDRGEKIDYMRKLRRWVAELTPDPKSRHDRQNVVRSFFINNGARVLTKPYPDVYNRPKPAS